MTVLFIFFSVRYYGDLLEYNRIKVTSILKEKKANGKVIIKNYTKRI